MANKRNIISISKTFQFEAAHYLPRVEPGHKCGRMHGHSFRFTVVLKGPVDEQTGWLVDFADISRVVKPLIESSLDHYCLNEIPGLENPTSERIAIWLWERLVEKLPLLNRITVHETCTSRCNYQGEIEDDDGPVHAG